MTTRTRPTTPLGAALARRRLTWSEAAARLGISKGTLGQYVTGRRRPTLNWLHAAAVTLGIDPHDLDDRLARRPPD